MHGVIFHPEEFQNSVKNIHRWLSPLLVYWTRSILTNYIPVEIDGRKSHAQIKHLSFITLKHFSFQKLTVCLSGFWSFCLSFLTCLHWRRRRPKLF